MPQTAKSYICDKCKGQTFWYSPHHWYEYEKIVCGGCVVNTILDDGDLVLHRTGDTVMVSIKFNELIHTKLCCQTDIMRKSITQLNYAVMKEVNEWVIISYESPIIRKLMGRGDINELLSGVQSRIIVELR